MCVHRSTPPEVLNIRLTTTPDSNNRLALSIPDSRLNARKMLQALIHIETFNRSKFCGLNATVKFNTTKFFYENYFNLKIFRSTVHVASYHVTSCYIMLHYVIACYIMLHWLTRSHVSISGHYSQTAQQQTDHSPHPIWWPNSPTRYVPESFSSYN